MRSSIARVSSLVVLLAAGPAAAAAAEGCSPPGRFVVAAGEVTDTPNGLVWRRCSHGLTWAESGGCTGTIAPVGYDEAVAVARAAGAPWRMPTADELFSLLEPACDAPPVDEAVFADIPVDPSGEPSLYWSSTDSGFEDMPVTIDFRYGFADMHSKGIGFHLRLVRTADPAAR